MRSAVVFSLFPLVISLFTEDFATFIEDNYGENFLDLLQRKDLGEKGSFGGRTSADEEVVNDPVIFVHGVSDTAGEKMKSIADKFIEVGYVEGELYATTYSNGAMGNPISWTQYSMRCEYVKQIRALILAVRYYTGRDVDIVAYSLGVPITRKAILGGFCVDTDEELGGPLTKYIDTFVGIAGPNHGVALKLAGLPIPACVLGAPPICDRVIGLYSGLCPFESMFLNDINKKEHYEGRHVFSIYSQSDHMVGYKVCGKITGTIPGEDGHTVFPNFDHDEVLLNAVDNVFTVLQNHTTFPQIRRPAGPKTTFRQNKRKEQQANRSALASSTTTSFPSRTTQKPQTTTLDVVRSLEAIFTDTKETSLQNIRNFFRQKFADEEEHIDVGKYKSLEENEKNRSGQTEQPRGRPIPDPKNTDVNQSEQNTHQEFASKTEQKHTFEEMGSKKTQTTSAKSGERENHMEILPEERSRSQQSSSKFNERNYEEINRVNAEKSKSTEWRSGEKGVDRKFVTSFRSRETEIEDSDLQRKPMESITFRDSSRTENTNQGRINDMSRKGWEPLPGETHKGGTTERKEIVPFMSSSQKEDRKGYLTRVRVQFEGCCN